MKLPRLLLPGVAVAAAAGLVAVTFLTGDDPALVDTSDIDARPRSAAGSPIVRSPCSRSWPRSRGWVVRWRRAADESSAEEADDVTASRVVG